jgi:hypothetical protein
MISLQFLHAAISCTTNRTKLTGTLSKHSLFSTNTVSPCLLLLACSPFMLTGRQAQKIVTADAADADLAGSTPPTASTPAAATASPDSDNSSSSRTTAAAAAAAVKAEGGFARMQQSLEGLMKSKVMRMWRLLQGRKLQKWPAEKRECVITVL